uniref:Toll-like receptor 22 n=1 Tax=Oryzias latipes TaxID=8090 RepID=A0A3B3HCC4_ORYLA
MGLEKVLNKSRSESKYSLASFLLLLACMVIPVGGFALKNCHVSRNTALCHNEKLNAVPQDVPKTVTSLDLSGNKLSRIRRADFSHVPHLIQLDLNRNYILQVDRFSFSNLTSLQKLNLNHNKLDKLDSNVFHGLWSLTELRIAHNKIKVVSSTSFQSLSSLRFLDISYNKLQNLTNANMILEQLPQLQELVIKQNNLTHFYSWELTNTSVQLHAVDLSLNPFQDFRITADVFPNLLRFSIGLNKRKPLKWDVKKTFMRRVSSLDISQLHLTLSDMRSLFQAVNQTLTLLRMNAMKQNPNKLINLSCSIPSMSTLQFRRNKLRRIEARLLELCTNVTELDLADNDIQAISEDAFKCLPHLKTLTLSGNKLPFVPSATRNLPGLYKLDLKSNSINRLQCQDFANQTELRILYLQNNSISNLKDCVFEDLVRLEILKLQSNKIIKLNNAFKRHLPNLRFLYLSNNQLAMIEKEEFKGLRSLQNLSLHQNNLGDLNEMSFYGLKNLIHMQLKANNIQKNDLDSGAFNALVSLKLLDLSNNHVQYKSEHPCKAPFSHLSHLEDFIFSAQRFRLKSHLPVNFLQGLTNLLHFDTRSTQLVSLHKDTFNHTPKMENLLISSNDLKALSPELFTPIPNLKSLYISRTQLSSLDFFIDANLKKLEFLQARGNQYSDITEEVILSLPALSYVDLQGNTFTCDCNNAQFLRWIKTSNQTQFYDAYNFLCRNPPSFKDKKLLNFDPSSCMVDTGFICFVSTTCSIVGLMLASIMFHFMRWQLVYSYYLFLAWLYDSRHQNKRSTNQYDAFISYNNHDEPWVMDELLPKLEGEQGWRLCLHHRDFEPGRPILDNITDAIYGSRKTICVISRRYLESEWCSREVQAAR